MEDSGIGVEEMLPMVFCESVRCGQGPLRQPTDGEGSAPPPQRKPRCSQTWESRDILEGPHDGMFQAFVITPVKWKEEEEEHTGMQEKLYLHLRFGVLCTL